MRKNKELSKDGDGEVIIRMDDSKNVIESIIFARAQSYSDVYRFRFMLELVKRAQECLRKNFQHIVNGEKVSMGEYDYAKLEFPLRYILYNDDDKNYEQAKRSLLRFKDWVLVEDTGDKFRMMPVLSFAEMDRYGSVLRVEIRKNLWDMFMDFSKGYTEYNPEVILKIASPFGRQIYKSLRNQKGVVSYSMDMLKKTFGYTGKYDGRDMEFIRRVVDKAKEELDGIADYSFEYEIVHGHGRSLKGRKTIARVDFRSVRHFQKASDDALRKLIRPSEVVGQRVYRILREKFSFSDVELKGNLKLFELASKRLGEDAFLEWLYKIAPMAVRAKSTTQGYVVGSLKRFLHQKCGIVYGNGKPVVTSPDDVAEVPAVRDVDVQVQDVPAQPASPSVPPRSMEHLPQRPPRPASRPQGNRKGAAPPAEEGLTKNQYAIGTLFKNSFGLDFSD